MAQQDRTPTFGKRTQRLHSKWALGAAAILCVLACVFAVEATAQNRAEPDAGRQARRAALGAVRSWGYQLRIQDLAPLIASDTGLLVIDHGRAAKRDGKLKFDPTEIAQLKTRSDGRRRLVLAYLSIGEAEQYRFYWRPEWCQRATAPVWMGAVNPNWPGNYPVRFWAPDWQRLILAPGDGYIAQIQAQGFDGIYLDRTDVYSEWTREQPSAERDMIQFLSAIAAAARANAPDFLVVMQNAEELLVHRDVRRAIDGVAKEDLLHGTNFSEAANNVETVTSSLAYLRRARTEKIPVFAVEYLSDPAKIAAARRRLEGYGFLPYFGPRLLDQLAPIPGGTRSPSVKPPAPVPALPHASSGEGGPTCLLD